MQSSDQASYEAGLKTRREVLGDEYVARALANADDFTRPFQEFVTAHAWDAVWNRPGLDRRTRSLLNLAMLAALGKGPELALHTRGALNNGVTPEEIREVFIQVAGYAGFPAAVEAFRVAQPVIAKSRVDPTAVDRAAEGPA